MIKEIPNFKNYFADENGNIFSNKPINQYGKISSEYKLLSFRKRRNYLAVNLCKESKVYSYSVHRLILETFIGKCPKGMEACHNDGNPTNNKLTNLRWDTAINNQKDRIKHNTSNRGIYNNTTKLNELQVRIIRKYPKHYRYIKFLSNIFNVSEVTILKIRNKTNWGWL